MHFDIKSNCTIAVHIAATSQSANTYTGTAVDMSLAPSCSFFINAGTFGSSATLDAKLQYSSDNNSWTDETSGAGNGTSITQMTAAGSAQLDVVNPRARYYRVSATVATAAVVYGITSVLGPNYSVSAG